MILFLHVRYVQDWYVSRMDGWRQNNLCDGSKPSNLFLALYFMALKVSDGFRFLPKHAGTFKQSLYS